MANTIKWLFFNVLLIVIHQAAANDFYSHILNTRKPCAVVFPLDTTKGMEAGETVKYRSHTWKPNYTVQYYPTWIQKVLGQYAYLSPCDGDMKKYLNAESIPVSYYIPNGHIKLAKVQSEKDNVDDGEEPEKKIKRPTHKAKKARRSFRRSTPVEPKENKKKPSKDDNKYWIIGINRQNINTELHNKRNFEEDSEYGSGFRKSLSDDQVSDKDGVSETSTSGTDEPPPKKPKKTSTNQKKPENEHEEEPEPEKKKKEKEPEKEAEQETEKEPYYPALIFH